MNRRLFAGGVLVFYISHSIAKLIKNKRLHLSTCKIFCNILYWLFLLDEKQRFSYERSGYDLDESDGADEDDNENEDDDEDSQAESVLSAAPSITASPQHLPSRSSLQDSVSADEDVRITDCFSGVHTDPRDVLPRALPTKMTVLSTVQSDYRTETQSPAKNGQQAAGDEDAAATPADSSRSPEAAPRFPCQQMSVDYPESAEILRSSVAGKAVALTQVHGLLLFV